MASHLPLPGKQHDPVPVVPGKEMRTAGAGIMALASDPSSTKRRLGEPSELNSNNNNNNLSSGKEHPPSKKLRSSDSSASDDESSVEEQLESHPTPSITGQRTGDHESTLCEDDSTNSEAWPDDVHRAFVEAVFRLGMRQASPSVILELMHNNQLPLTSERVKSRLQKYRNNSSKSHAEFMQEYDTWITKALTIGRAGGAAANCAEPAALLEMMGVETLLGGDMAAFLTYSCIAQDSNQKHALASPPNIKNLPPNSDEPEQSEAHHAALSGEALTAQQLWNGSQDYAKYFSGSEIKLPSLTERERNSPLGASIAHVASLFYTITQHIMKFRSSSAEVKTEDPVQVFGERRPDMEESQPASSQQQLLLLKPQQHPDQSAAYLTSNIQQVGTSNPPMYLMGEAGSTPQFGGSNKPLNFASNEMQQQYSQDEMNHSDDPTVHHVNYGVRRPYVSDTGMSGPGFLSVPTAQHTSIGHSTGNIKTGLGYCHAQQHSTHVHAKHNDRQ